ncbi:MAG: hypothetical protein GX304_03620 [Clostridiales bacterium]|jgi:hypothetical protein|nr:hypothetical protein [Clostridiales bacterium]
MDKDKKRNYTQEAFYSNSIVSATEYTGLIYPVVDTEDEAEAYTEDFKINAQKKAEIGHKPQS